MKKTEIERIPLALPEDINRLCRGARIFDSSCSPEAKVYFIDREDGYYLKVGAAGSLSRERLMTEYFHRKGLGTEVLSFVSGENDILLTRAVAGDDCTAARYLDEPKRLCDLVAERLRMLHELDCSDCPVQDRVSEYVASAEASYRADCYNKEHFPDSFGYRSGEEAFAALSAGRGLLKNDCLIHGDYCLPNMMLDDWRFSGFIDVGRGGVGDRHIDIFWGEWSMGFNLMIHGEPQWERYKTRFLDAYGQDKIEKEVLSVVAAAEVFG